MDHFHPKQSGHPPKETTGTDHNTDPTYPVNGESFFQNHFPSQAPAQNTAQTPVGTGTLDPFPEPPREDDTKEYIPSTGSTAFYNGYPPPVEPVPPTAYPVGGRELAPEHYIPSSPNQEPYVPMQEEHRSGSPTGGDYPASGLDSNYRPHFPPTTSSNVMQGQPPITGQPSYPVHPNHPTPNPYPVPPTHSNLGNQGNMAQSSTSLPASPFQNREASPLEETVPFPPNSFQTPSYPPLENTGVPSPYTGDPVSTYGTPPYYQEGIPVPPPSTGEFLAEPSSYESILPTVVESSLPAQQIPPNKQFETPYIQEATPVAVLNLWKCVLEILSTKLSPVCIDAWFYKETTHESGHAIKQPVLPVSFQGDTFTLMTSDSFVKEMFDQSFSANVSQALQELVNNPIKVVIKLNHSSEVLEEVKQENYNINFTFENFIESKDNETAYQFSKKIAESETVEFNPFFIYGQSGLGKTHLVCAIANAKKAQMEKKNKIQFEQTGYVGKKFKIAYTTGLEWVQEWISAIQSKNTHSFKEKYVDCDLFILDDVQFLAERRNTQEELFNLFEIMTRFQRQVVFTSDCHPTKLNGFHDRLTGRFTQGLSQEVKFPDFETCIAITRSKAEQKGLNLPDSLIELIAENTKSSVREIEGMVNKVFAKCDMSSKSELDKETIMSLVKDIVVDNKESGPSPKDFIRSVSAYFDVKESDLIAHGRTKQIVRPRNIAIFIIRNNTDLSLKEIGELFSGRDHSTIKNSLNNIDTMIKKEEKSGSSLTKQEVEDIIHRAERSPGDQETISP